MADLKYSKTVWGFGLALLLFIVRVVLTNYFGYEVNDTVWLGLIEVVAYLLGFWGIYGFRDAIRKLHFEKTSLTTSKTMWGFGIAMLIFAVKSVLSNVFGIEISDVVMTSIINVIEIIASFVGVVGIRDSLNKLREEPKL